mmetsp:Transcript_20654/g.34747  ORF Transcript_20654/g.34747 Transcript_20654/m.34747 type:complete len:288 (-) Transcript_20654:2975-3838(-)
MSHYIFLQRKRDTDIPHIRRMLHFLMALVPSVGDTHSMLSLLIFPEGTDLSESNVMKSNTYAKQNNLKEREYVLHPKSTGLITAIECFRERDRMVRGRGEGSVLHDLTLAYEDRTFGERPSEKGLFSGEFPRAVHVHVERHVVDELPQSSESLAKWLQDSFTRKELLLKDFYMKYAVQSDAKSDISYPTNIVPCTLQSWPSLVSHPLSFSQTSFSQSTLSLLIINLLMLGLTCGIWYLRMIRLYVMLISIGYTACLFYGGIDNIELKFNGRSGLCATRDRVGDQKTD